MAPPKKRLGRGLGNLIAGGVSPKPASPASASKISAQAAVERAAPQPADRHSSAGEATPSSDSHDGNSFREISVAAIEPNPYQPRRDLQMDQVKDLAESIRSEGLLQPIVVRPSGERFELIAGERRWRAHQLLGLKTILARVIAVSDASSAVISLIENLQREQLNPIEESLGYASLMGDFDLTQEAVAERVGKARASVANSLRLLQLDREIQGYLAKGMLSIGHAKVLLGLDDTDQRSLLARQIVESGWSVRETESRVKQLKGSAGRVRQSSSRTVSNAEATVIANLEKQLASRLNTKVQVKHTPKKGQIIIDYYGNEDLQRILELTQLEPA